MALKMNANWYNAGEVMHGNDDTDKHCNKNDHTKILQPPASRTYDTKMNVVSEMEERVYRPYKSGFTDYGGGQESQLLAGENIVSVDRPARSVIT